jgi:hypothetical protein
MYDRITAICDLLEPSFLFRRY